MTQQVKDLALSLLWYALDPGPEFLHAAGVAKKKKKKKKKTGKNQNEVKKVFNREQRLF